MHDVAHAIDRFCIPSRDDVTQEQPGARGRPVRIYAYDENTARTAGRFLMGWGSAPQWLQAGTNISPKNMTPREELIDDAIDCRRRNSKYAATWPQDGHAGRRGREAAQSMLHSKKWSWLKAWAMQIARRRGMKKAIVALARRLAVIMHRIWVDGTEFRWTREQAAAAA